MAHRCFWCATDIGNDPEERTVYLQRFIHKKCLKILKRRLKQEGWTHPEEGKQMRMNEEKAVEILKKAKDYYGMKRKDYDAVIKWLEGRIKRKKKG
jgi:Lhr-like helicase